MNNNLKTFLNYFILIILFIYFSFLLFRLLMSRPILDPLVVTGFLSIFYIFLELFKIFLISLIFVIKKFFNLKNSTTLVTFFKKVKFYFENDFLQDFLDNKVFFNRVFILIFKIFAFLSKKLSPKKITFGVVYLPWIIFLMVFLKEIFIEENISLSLYFLFFCFFLKRIFIFLAWIGLFKSIQLKEFVFLRDFPAFCNSCQEFFSKNLLFKKDLFFFQPTLQEKNLLLFIWNAYIEIDFCFRVQSYIYGCSKIYFDFAEKFIKIFNLWFFSIIFIFLLTENQVNIILRKLFLLGFFCYFLYFCYFHFFYQKAVDHDKLDLVLTDTLEKKIIFKENLLLKYTFLNSSDLPDLFVLGSIKNLSKYTLFFKKPKEQNLFEALKFEKISLTADQKQKLFQVTSYYCKWLQETFASRNIDLLTYQLLKS